MQNRITDSSIICQANGKSTKRSRKEPKEIVMSRYVTDHDTNVLLNYFYNSAKKAQLPRAKMIDKRNVICFGEYIAQQLIYALKLSEDKDRIIELLRRK